MSNDYPLDPERWLAALAAEGTALISAVEQAPDLPVTACPDWTTSDLLDHVAGLYVFVAGIVAAAGEKPTTGGGSLREGDADLFQASRAALADLLGQLEQVEADAPAWSWSPDDDTAAFWFRRMCQETLTHRLDVELAAGATTDVDPALAADGVDEVLTLFLPRVFRRVGGFTQLVGTMRVAVTDVDAGPWHVEITDDDLIVRALPGGTRAVIEAVPDLEVAGTALQVLLFLWGRGDAQTVGVDPAHRMVVGLAEEFRP